MQKVRAFERVTTGEYEARQRVVRRKAQQIVQERERLRCGKLRGVGIRPRFGPAMATREIARAGDFPVDPERRAIEHESRGRGGKHEPKSLRPSLKTG